jgi:RNA polymerase sigma-70 factor (ECF subfamily)
LSLPQPDHGVLRKAQRGDERAFSIIVRAYQIPVYNYVLRMIGDRALAEDLTQEVFLRVFQGLPRFSLRSKFTTWLFQVTKNRVLDELLSVDLKMALLLRDVVGLSYSEIADSLEVTLSTVKWRIWKAREDVQLSLAREGIELFEERETPALAVQADMPVPVLAPPALPAA